MTDQKPSDALTKRPRPLRTALLVGAAVVALSGGGVGAYAITQNVNAPVAAVVESPAPEPNADPIASFSFVGSDGLEVSVDGSNSLDSDGELVSYEWDFGDGQTGIGATATHTYGDYGTFTVTLTVTDDAGAEGSFSADVELDAPSPPPPAPPAPPAAPSCPSGATPNEVSNGVIISCIYGPEYCSEYSPDHPDWHCRGPFNI